MRKKIFLKMNFERSKAMRGKWILVLQEKFGLFQQIRSIGMWDTLTFDDDDVHDQLMMEEGKRACLLCRFLVENSHTKVHKRHREVDTLWPPNANKYNLNEKKRRNISNTCSLSYVIVMSATTRSACKGNRFRPYLYISDIAIWGDWQFSALEKRRWSLSSLPI